MKRLQTILFSLVFLFNYCFSSYCSNSFESKMKYTCESLYINTTHSCVYSNGKCDFSFKSCSSYTGKDSSTCSSIILSSTYKKCQLVNEVCKEVDKTCEDYNSSLSMTCSYLNPGNNKRCVYNDDKCETHYDNCADFTRGVDETKCKANIPSDSNHKCIWKNNACTEVNKECNDYSSTNYYSCSSLSASSTDKVNVFLLIIIIAKNNIKHVNFITQKKLRKQKRIVKLLIIIQIQKEASIIQKYALFQVQLVLLKIKNVKILPLDNMIVKVLLLQILIKYVYILIPNVKPNIKHVNFIALKKLPKLKLAVKL